MTSGATAAFGNDGFISIFTTIGRLGTQNNPTVQGTNGAALAIGYKGHGSIGTNGIPTVDEFATIFGTQGSAATARRDQGRMSIGAFIWKGTFRIPTLTNGAAASFGDHWLVSIFTDFGRLGAKDQGAIQGANGTTFTRRREGFKSIRTKNIGAGNILAVIFGTPRVAAASRRNGRRRAIGTANWKSGANGILAVITDGTAAAFRHSRCTAIGAKFGR